MESPPPASASPSPPSLPWESALAGWGGEEVWIQVLVRRCPPGFELRHVGDRAVADAGLREVRPEELRGLAETNRAGGFRPLRSAPDLVDGWRCGVVGPAALGRALEALYPGSLGDWWAGRAGGAAGAASVDFAAMAAAQVGGAKVMTELRGPGLAAVVAAACRPESCLRHRRWSGEGLPADEAGAKSRVPCWEPCPMFRRFARACAEQETRASVPIQFASDDLATLAAALRHVQEQGPSAVRLGEVAAPLHPWRVARLLARWRETWPAAGSIPTDTDE